MSRHTFRVCFTLFLTLLVCGTSLAASIILR
jgi:hypothetical protein